MAILVKGLLSPEPLPKEFAEIVWVRIHPLDKAQWHIGCCYRPEAAEEIMFQKICESINKNVDITNFVGPVRGFQRSALWPIFPLPLCAPTPFHMSAPHSSLTQRSTLHPILILTLPAPTKPSTPRPNKLSPNCCQMIHEPL